MCNYKQMLATVVTIVFPPGFSHHVGSPVWLEWRWSYSMFPVRLQYFSCLVGTQLPILFSVVLSSFSRYILYSHNQSACLTLAVPRMCLFLILSLHTCHSAHPSWHTLLVHLKPLSCLFVEFQMWKYGMKYRNWPVNPFVLIYTYEILKPLRLLYVDIYIYIRTRTLRSKYGAFTDV